jgi:tRNA threonylcarbamoyladenosine biosynthesis protein TsaB
MSLLAIDTSTDRAVLALATDDGRMWVSATEAGRRHGRDLLPRLKDLLESAGVSTDEVGAIAVGLGPGSYTGLRVGVTAAKTLAYVNGAPLVGLESLHAIGRDAPASALRVSVIADAQRDELYVAEFGRAAAGAPLVPLVETRIEGVSSWLSRLGPGIVVLGPALASPGVRSSVPVALIAGDGAASGPTGESLVAAAREVLSAGRRENPWLLEPRYLRRSAAEDLWESRVPAPGG